MTIAHITFEYLGKEKLEIEEYIKIMTALKGINFVRLDGEESSAKITQRL